MKKYTNVEDYLEDIHVYLTTDSSYEKQNRKDTVMTNFPKFYCDVIFLYRGVIKGTPIEIKDDILKIQ